MGAPAHRPPPDDAAVLEVFELSFIKRWPYPRIIEHSRTRPWGPISAGTVSAWVRKGHEWWAATERQNHIMAVDLQRMWVGRFMEVLAEAHEDGEISAVEFVREGLPVLKRHAELEGTDAARRIKIEGTDGSGPHNITPAQRRQIEALRQRVQREERASGPPDVIDG